MSISSIKYMHQCSLRFCALLIILFNLFSGLPALAETGHEGSPLSPVTSFDQTMLTAPRSSQLLETYFRFTPSALSAADASQPGMGYNWKGPPSESQDWRGISRDTFYFVSLQFAVIVVLYFGPEELSGWSQETKDDYSFSKWLDNVKNPVWDEDKWYVNYILHPYWGATYYIRAQERGFNRARSFWYSFLLSALYEFGAEALFEPVSYQDLIVTPVAGALLGEYVFNPIRKWARAKDQLDWMDKTLLFATDPLGVVSEELSRIFGINTRVSFSQLKTGNSVSSSGTWEETATALPVRTRFRPVWGMRMKVSW
jgi:hypothetical protein